MNSIKPFLQEFCQPSTSFTDTGCSQTYSGSPVVHDLEDRHSSYSKPLSSVARICYPFFISHLHNPYPTLEEKEALLKQSGTSDITLTSISNWFSNSRRRCRWIEICNEFFAGDSKRMVTACEWVLNRNAPEITDHPSQPHSVVNAILSMQKRVQSWHEVQTEPCPFVAELCEITYSYTLEDNELIEIGYQVLTGQDLGRPQTYSQESSTPYFYIEHDDSPPSPIKRKAGSLLESDDQSSESPPSLVMRSSSSLSSHSDDSEQMPRTPSLTWSPPTDDEKERPWKHQRSAFPLINPAFFSVINYRSEPLTSSDPDTPSSSYSMLESPLKVSDDLSIPFVFGNTDDSTPFTFSIPWDFQDSSLLQHSEPLELDQVPAHSVVGPEKRMRDSEAETDIRPSKRVCSFPNADSVSTPFQSEVPHLTESFSTELVPLIPQAAISLDLFNEPSEKRVPAFELLGDGQPPTDVVTNFVDVSFWSQFLDYTENQPPSPSPSAVPSDQLIIPGWVLDDTSGTFDFDLSTLSDVTLQPQVPKNMG